MNSVGSWRAAPRLYREHYSVLLPPLNSPSVFEGAQKLSRRRLNLQGHSHPVPNSSSTSAMSVTLAMESHSAVFVVFAFATAPLVSAGNSEDKHFISLLRTSSIRSPRLLLTHLEPTAHRMSASISRPQGRITVKRACIPCIFVRELLMKHRIARLVQVRTSRIIP